VDRKTKLQREHSLTTAVSIRKYYSMTYAITDRTDDCNVHSKGIVRTLSKSELSNDHIYETNLCFHSSTIQIKFNKMSNIKGRKVNRTAFLFEALIKK